MSSVTNKSNALPTSFLNSNLRPGSRDQTNGTSSLLTSNLTSWGSTASIWSKPSASFAGNGLTSTAARDGLTARDSAPKLRSHETIEGKTGSGALVDSSVSDDSWATRTSAFSTKITDRSTIDFKPSEVSYGQQRDPTHNPAMSQAYGGASRHPSISTFNTRHAPVNLTTTNGSKGPFANTFEMPTALTSANDPPQVFTKFNNSSGGSNNPSRPADSAWGDGPIMHSPADERKSSNTAGFGFPSQSSSRNNSLPPSRHSDVQPQFPVRSDLYPDSQSAAHALRQNSMSGVSRPNGLASYRSESSANPLSIQFAQMSVGGGENQAFGGQHRGSVSSYSGQVPSYSSVSPVTTRSATYGTTNITFEAEEVEDIPRAFAGGDAYNSHANGVPPNFHIPQYDARPYDSNALQYSRQAPHYTGSAACQRALDRLNVSQPMNGLNNSAHGHAAVLDQRLRQIAPEPQFLPDARQLAMMNRQAPPNPYGQYAFAHGMPVYPFHPGFAQGISMGMMPIMDVSMIPKAPRGEQFEPPPGVRSQLLEDFKQNAKTNKRYDLKDIYEHVVEFSGDQHGSRFIQLKLETANSDEKERIFREIQPNALQLMTDVFGNYVIQKFFEHGDQTQKKILANKMRGQVRQLSLQMYGCRVVQKALDHILNDQQATLILELKDDVIRCVKDQNGNHVIQKAIERCDPKDIDFIFSAFTNQIHTLSIHTYGCRVIQRCLEHCELPTRRSILRELQESMPGLIGDAFGNYVVQHVVEHGEEHDKQKVYDLVLKGLEGFSKHKFASNVVEVCLTHAPDSWRKEVLSIIIAGNRREGEGMLIGFIRDNYGNYVIQKLLDVISQSDYYNLIGILQQEMNRAKRTGCGKQVMAIEKKMHRFGPSYGCLHGSASMPFTSHNPSAATTPPPLTSDTRSVQTSSVASVNGDTIEGAGLPSVHKGSIPDTTEPIVYSDFVH